ncbi:MAG TPA: adenine phosphoribosyltransferase [Nakamurella sp.]|jgi:adenine phosphoribosyltransferase
MSEVLAAAGAALDRLVRFQPDFPQPGVLFRDLTPVLAGGPALRAIAMALASAAPDATLVAGLDSRGFLLGAAAAMVAGTGVLAIRKPGKLPGRVLAEEYALEYGTARLELHPDDVPDGARVLVVDDVLATGGTAAARRAAAAPGRGAGGRCRRRGRTRRVGRPDPADGHSGHRAAVLVGDGSLRPGVRGRRTSGGGKRPAAALA